ncbi:MAG: ribonuclease III [candidate division Zixibacteria bacterium]|nr:ribonuclease III [candidate division Zixibacteria bacterium]
MPNLLSRWFSRRRRRSAADEVAAQSVLGYHFRDPDLLQEALTHRSYANSVEPSSTYERLEFLGDSVLGLVVARYLYLKHAELDEGELTKLKASLVNLKTLTAVARREGLGDVIRISVEEDKAGGRLRGSILSDVLESIIGAVYLDGGLDAASALVERVVIRPLVEQTPDLMEVNYKGELLEHLQGQGLGMPRYEVTDERGPDHQKIFTVVVYAQGRVAGEGTGANKKDAEQQAARAALNTLGIMPEREVAP